MFCATRMMRISISISPRQIRQDTVKISWQLNQFPLPSTTQDKTGGAGVGLQIEGLAEQVMASELPKVTALYFSRKYPYGKVSGGFSEEFQKLLQKKVYSFYRITPTRVWMNNPNANVDERVKIDLR